MPTAEPGTSRFTVDLPNDELAALRRRADEENLFMTQHVRRLIRADARANPSEIGSGDEPRRDEASEATEQVR